MTQKGDVVGGKYEILQLLGEGGMSKVWLASDDNLKKEWAVKEIRRDSRDEFEREKLEMLEAEALLMRDFNHPVLPRVTDIIRTDDAMYVVMDRVPGKSLEKVMEEQGHPFGYEEVIAWGKDLCDALTYLHSNNPPIIYRDMKPSNIMLNDDNTVKLIDFGTARQYKVNKGDTIVAYTPEYAPSEQARGQSSIRSDVYTLGATLHNLVTGWLPTEDKTLRPPIRSLDAKLPEGLDYIISKATQEDPDQRYQTCAEMKHDLENYKKLTREFRAEQEAKLRRFNRLWIAAIALAVVGVACLLLSAYFRNSTYEAYIQQAETADAVEVIGQQDEQVPEAEGMYMRAIEVNPQDMRAYQGLVQGYKNNSTIDASGNTRGDFNFTKTEAARWSQVFNDHRDSISDSEEYAQLCYDIGLLYFVYFENEAEGLSASDDERDYAASGTVQAKQWFERAAESYEEKQAAGAPCTLSERDYRAARIYEAIGEFNDRLKRAMREGSENTVYEDYWDTLTDAIALVSESDAAVDSAAEDMATIVRLRLYQIVYEALGSPTYLNGFSQVGITAVDAVAMYHDVLDLFAFSATDEAAKTVSASAMAESEKLYNAAKTSATPRALYEEISSHRANVASTIETIYNDTSLFGSAQEDDSMTEGGDTR